MTIGYHNAYFPTLGTFTLREVGRGWRVVASAAEVPGSSGCYAVYHDGFLVYIGSSIYLPQRAQQYFSTRQRRLVNGCARAKRGTQPVVTVKVAPCRKAGEWLMREYRLIRRLRPRDNRAFSGDLKSRPERRVRLKPCLGCDAGHFNINDLIACEHRQMSTDLRASRPRQQGAA